MATTTISATGTNDHTVLANAITAATAGDTIVLNDGTYNFGATVNVTKQLTIKGQSQTGTVVKANAAFTATPIINFSANSCVLQTLTFDGNGALATNENQGFYFAKVNGLTITDVTSKNFRGHQGMIYGCKTGTITRLITLHDTNCLTGTSHGIDNDSSYYTGISITRDGGAGANVTAAITGHNIVAGDYVNFQDATDTDYNGVWLVNSVVAGVSVSVTLAGDPGGNATASVGRDSKDISYVDCNLYNGYQSGGRQSIKIEATSGHTLTNCTLRSEFSFGDNVSTENLNVTVDTCTLDGVGYINLKTSTFSPTIQDSTFTRDGGALLFTADVGANTILTDNTFLGRNRWVGFASGLWTSPARITETGSQHPGADSRTGKTIFASYNSTGEQWGTVPYITPNTARANYEDLVEDVNLDEDNMHYALLSDRGVNVLPSNETNIQLPSVITAILEGYPDIAVIDVSATTADWLNDASGTTDSIIRKLHLKGGRGASQQAFRCNGSSFTIEDCIVEDYSGGSTGTGVEARGAAVAAPVTVKMIRCLFKDIVNGGGPIAYSQADTQAVTLTLEGCRFIDCSSTANGVARIHTTALTAGKFHNCEFIRCSSTGVGALMNGQAATQINNCTFVACNNTSGTDDDVTSSTAVTLKNCIIENNANLGGAGTKTLTNCLVGDGIGSHTDGGGNVTGTPTYANAASDDYNLASGSAGLGVGVNWWTTSANPVGYNGEPLSDIDVDIGANPSTLGPFHPVNL